VSPKAPRVWFGSLRLLRSCGRSCAMADGSDAPPCKGNRSLAGIERHARGARAECLRTREVDRTKGAGAPSGPLGGLLAWGGHRASLSARRFAKEVRDPEPLRRGPSLLLAAPVHTGPRRTRALHRSPRDCQSHSVQPLVSRATSVSLCRGPGRHLSARLRWLAVGAKGDLGRSSRVRSLRLVWPLLAYARGRRPLAGGFAHRRAVDGVSRASQRRKDAVDGRGRPMARSISLSSRAATSCTDPRPLTRRTGRRAHAGDRPSQRTRSRRPTVQ
jgi:hypothetical protein